MTSCTYDVTPPPNSSDSSARILRQELLFLLVLSLKR
jgi:hypothetical protein